MINQTKKQEITQLYTTKRKEMISYSYSICKDKKIAEDVIHNTFEGLLLKNDFDKIRNLYSYSFKCIKWNTYKLIKAARIHCNNVETSYNISNNHFCYNEKSYDFLKEKIIEDCIDSLPQKRKRVFIMKRIEKKSIKNISKELSISPKTVENHITNAIKELKIKLDPYKND